MNKSQARNIAKAMVKKGVSAYGGGYQIAEIVKIHPGKLTPTAIDKVMKEFYQLIVEGTGYHAIQVMFAEEKLGGNNARKPRKSTSAQTA